MKRPTKDIKFCEIAPTPRLQKKVLKYLDYLGTKQKVKDKWTKEKKWQRNGGKVAYTSKDGNCCYVNSHIDIAFDDPNATYNIVPATYDNRMKNLRNYEIGGGKLEAKKKDGTRWLTTNTKWKTSSLKYGADKKLVYRKAAKF